MHKIKLLNLNSSVLVNGPGSKCRKSACDEYARNDIRKQTLGIASFPTSKSAISDASFNTSRVNEVIDELLPSSRPVCQVLTRLLLSACHKNLLPNPFPDSIINS
jgi:hypothetical protein